MIKNQQFSISVLITLCSTLPALAQTPSRIGSGSTPRPPYTVEFKITHVQTLANGTTITTETKEVMARDQQMRRMNSTTNAPTGDRPAFTTVRVTAPLSGAAPTRLDADLARIGGSYRWYGLTLAWRVRALLGRVAGENWKLNSPTQLVRGATVDWWFVARRDPGMLVLRAIRWFPGEAWLGYQCTEHDLIQVGSLRPKGIPGFLYWKMLQPVHRQVFQALARHRVTRAG